MSLGHDDRTFSDYPSEHHSNLLAQESFYSDFGTAVTMDSEVSSSMWDGSSMESSFSLEEPRRMETIYDLQPHIDRIRARTLEQLPSEQSERVRFRRPFPPSRSSSFKSSLRSSCESCNVHMSSFHESFLKNGDDHDRLDCNIASIPENDCAISTADTLLKQNDCGKSGGGHDQESFDSFCAEEGLDDERVGSGYFSDDWPARDAKVRFRPTGEESDGSDHRRDSVLPCHVPFPEETNATGMV
eukprot:TRINITY_DN26685_c0_g1_i2.p1 TRINITY_DN26685_c0_g1~~TRINITY_DN26685_c0_g1_i2.p1  ORF type:complete len:243 (+),score=33.46 TRINITY_DN26685_c0_g1_i2:65-793(+)